MYKFIEIEINIAGIDITVNGYYSPEEPMVMYYPDGNGYPGCSSEFDIKSIQVNGANIAELISDKVYNEIKEKVINHIENK